MTQEVMFWKSFVFFHDERNWLQTIKTPFIQNRQIQNDESRGWPLGWIRRAQACRHVNLAHYVPVWAWWFLSCFTVINHKKMWRCHQYREKFNQTINQFWTHYSRWKRSHKSKCDKISTQNFQADRVKNSPSTGSKFDIVQGQKTFFTGSKNGTLNSLLLTDSGTAPFWRRGRSARWKKNGSAAAPPQPKEY